MLNEILIGFKIHSKQLLLLLSLILFYVALNVFLVNGTHGEVVTKAVNEFASTLWMVTEMFLKISVILYVFLYILSKLKFWLGVSK